MFTSGNKSSNTAIGYGAGLNITTGTGNTMVGRDILNVGGSTTGSYNVMIGYPNGAMTLTSLSSNYQININNSIVRNTSGQYFLNTNTTPSSIPTFTASAALEINGTAGAVLFPRLTTTQRDALTATDGMVIYNTSTSKLQVRAGGAWVDLH
jgi:hypothetical protein